MIFLMSGRKAHIEHPVSLVEHERLQMRQIDGFLIDMIEQAARAGYDYLITALQFSAWGLKPTPP